MKQLFTLVLSILLINTMTGQAVLTAVFDCDLPGGTPKGVEIYVTNDIPDLTMLGISSANNGTGPTGTPEFTFPAGSAIAGQYIYLSSEEPNFMAWFGFASDFVDPDGSVNINGDDAIELFFNGTVIDVFGDVNMDGSGMPWEYLDGWAARMPGTGPDGSTFVLGNWTYSGPGAVDGATSNANALSPVPLKSYTGGMATPDHVVNAMGLAFTPSSLVVDIGDIVEWNNTGGVHNVNGSQATFSGNSEDFFSGVPADAPWSWQYTFTNPGHNDYQCDLHAGAGMVGSVMVRESGDHYVEVENNFFAPRDITIELGESVVWTNISGRHNVNGTQATYPGNPESFGNGPADFNWTYAHTFTVPGTYDFQCDPHAGSDMKGTVTVISPYSAVSMATAKQIDVDGNALFQDSLITVTGVVHGPNYRSTGIEFFLIDGINDGLLVRTTGSVPAYTVTEGDELVVSGTVNQFNGLIQLVPDVISINSQGNQLNVAEDVDQPSEETEAAFITIRSLTLVDTAQWPNDNQSRNVFAVNVNGDTILIRIDSDIDFDIPAPLGLFDVFGLGGQFDNSDPYTEGYQILPRNADDIATGVGIYSTADIGITNVFPNPVADELFIQSDEIVMSISVYDVLGRQVMKMDNPSNGALNFSISIDNKNIAAGMHILELRTALGAASMLFVKE